MSRRGLPLASHVLYVTSINYEINLIYKWLVSRKEGLQIQTSSEQNVKETDLSLLQRTEHNHLINSVEQLWSEKCLQLFHY